MRRRRGFTRLSSKHQVTIPVAVLERAGAQPGDEFRVDAAALDRHAGDDLRLPASAYAEVLVRPTRIGKADRARAEVEALALQIDPIGRDAAEAAARLRARVRSLRLPDALVLGHAEAIGADGVLTSDVRLRRISPRVCVVGENSV